MSTYSRTFRGVTAIALFYLLLSSVLFANERNISIVGNFNSETRLFSGIAIFKLPYQSGQPIWFHLPANRYSDSDCRDKYYIRSTTGEIQIFNRSELGELKKFHLENLHHPGSIQIESVEVDGKNIDFQILNNPDLYPLHSVKNTLLKIDPGTKLNNDKNQVEILIKFVTKFNKLPKGYVEILWDFAPRPVVFHDDHPDYSDQLSQPSEISISVQTHSGNDRSLSSYIRSGTDTKPVIVLDQQDDNGDHFQFIADAFLSDQENYFKDRIKRVEFFLFQTTGLKPVPYKRQYVIWDGKLSVTGSVILLPRRIMRYHPYYYKAFEILLLQALIESTVVTHYTVDKDSSPWILPAIVSEFIRSYLRYEYGENTRFFPWGNWLNPDYYQENTIKPWITNQEAKILLSATDPKILENLTNVYHPGYEKGFHLFRSIIDQKENLKDKLLPNIINFLQPEYHNHHPFLSETFLFDQLGLTNKQREKARLWLSTQGKVDYDISSVNLTPLSDQYSFEVDINSHGNLQPPFDLSVELKDGTKEIKEITTGTGKYYFLFNSQPESMEIDPRHALLENNLINNSWHLPLKVRPVWDFPSSDDWIVTLTPVINGNTFDKNLFGLSLGISYLSETELYISGWRAEGDDQVLWESEFIHYGFPVEGSEITFESSELNASYSKLAGYKYNFYYFHPSAWIGLNLTEEKFRKIEEETITVEKNVWQGSEISFSFPVYIGDFSDATFEGYYRYGKNAFESSFDFHQYGFKSGNNLYLKDIKLALNLTANYSFNDIPFQKKYPMGGPEGLPGFPRETELLFDQRSIIEIGITAPAYFTHTNLNLLRLGWLDRIETELLGHWGKGEKADNNQPEIFKDIELRFYGYVSWFNMYEGNGYFSVAQPIDNEKYKDYRIILFSNWVF